MIKHPWKTVAVTLVSTALQFTTAFGNYDIVELGLEQSIISDNALLATPYQNSNDDNVKSSKSADAALNSDAEQDFNVEQQLTAALIYKLTGFVEFPNEPSLLTMCFSGQNGWAISDVLENKQKEGKLKQPIKVLKHSALSQIEPLSCQFIYISPASRLEESTIRQLSRDSLTISDSDDFRNIGHISSIQFVNAKPVISISKKGLKASNIQLSSRLLSSITVKP